MTEPVCVLKGLIEGQPPGIDPAAAPVSTRLYHLSENTDEWTHVGASPLMMMSRQTVMYVVADEQPTESPVDGFRLEPRVTAIVALKSQVWAASTGEGGADLIVAGPE